MGLVALNWWNSVEQGWSKSGHIWGDALGPFHWSGKMAILVPEVGLAALKWWNRVDLGWDSPSTPGQGHGNTSQVRNSRGRYSAPKWPFFLSVMAFFSPFGHYVGIWTPQ